MTIRKKFIIFSILWGVIPVIISTVLLVVNFNNKNMELVRQNVKAFSNDQSTRLEDFFNQNVSNLKINSDIPIVKKILTPSNGGIKNENDQLDMRTLNEFLISNEKEQPYLDGEVIANRDGIVIAANDEKYMNKNNLLSEEEMQKVEENEVVVTDIVKREDINNGARSVVTANPIFYDDKYQGFISNIIKVDYFDRFLNGMRFYKTGKVVIMDAKGVVASSSSKDVTENISNINISNDLYEQWKNTDFSSQPNGIIEYNMGGIKKIGYYSKITNTGWVVLSSVEMSEFNESINKSLINIAMFLLLIFLIAISSYVFMINHFSRPMYKLIEVIRKVKLGNYKDRFMYNKKNEFGEIATAFNGLIDTIEKNKKHIENKNKQLESLASNIPGGVHRNVIVNGEHVLDFLSGGCLKLMGYKRHEFRKLFGRRIFDVIYEEDRERVKREIKEQMDEHGRFTVEYRIKRKDGNIIWVLDNGKMVKDRDGKTFSYNVAINITDVKKAQEELRVSEERYRIVTSQTDDIIFEWNIKEDTIFYSGNWERKFSSKPITEDISKKIYETDIIHKDDLKVFRKMLNGIVIGKPYDEIEIRLKRNKDVYIWCKVRITAIFDSNGDISKALGIIIDIDKEKKEAQELLFKAQRDSLTRLYNKGITESMIKEYIENQGKEVNGALFLIDVDNFKSINDNLGHLAGDFALISISSMLSNIFKENSVVGRIGGDEFIVFLKDISSEEFIYEKAEELVKGFRTNFTKEFSNYKISGSIGISKYPEHGTCFKELYVNADRATYLAKSKGKDNYCIFTKV